MYIKYTYININIQTYIQQIHRYKCKYKYKQYIMYRYNVQFKFNEIRQ